MRKEDVEWQDEQADIALQDEMPRGTTAENARIRANVTTDKKPKRRIL